MAGLKTKEIPKVIIDFLNDENVSNEEITFVVIVSRYNDQWVVVRHRERSTWEAPGGHREDKEDIKKRPNANFMKRPGPKNSRFSRFALIW